MPDADGSDCWRDVPIKVSEMQQISYKIESFSSYSASYHPENIIVSAPHDQSSRWSCPRDSGTEHFLLLKLAEPAIIQRIVFGKFHKVHVCNLKDLKVYIGWNPENMTQVLRVGLKNDSSAEAFIPRYWGRRFNCPIPARYVRVVPLSTWGNGNFNFSIWHLGLAGCTSDAVIQRALRVANEFRVKEATRICCKFFNSHFPSVQLPISSDWLEGKEAESIRSLLFSSSVDWDRLVAMIQGFPDAKFLEYLRERAPLQGRWVQLASSQGPSARGGHQMAINCSDQVIYVFGGWNGVEDVADFWCYSIGSATWKKLSSCTLLEGGPTPRSCHRAVWCSKRRVLYVIGKFLEDSEGTAETCDFFTYTPGEDRWRLLSRNCALEGGPSLVYDHQVAIDPSGRWLFVFGGKTVGCDEASADYAPLFRYDVDEMAWSKVELDGTNLEFSLSFTGRIGHSMLLVPTAGNRFELHVLGGQRGKEFLSEHVVFDPEAATVVRFTGDVGREGGPNASHTQRAVFDEEHQEIFVAAGHLRDRSSAAGASDESTQSLSLFRYSLAIDKWEKISIVGDADALPPNRYAFQFVCDPAADRCYVFGGNPGTPDDPRRRLDDLWCLQLLRATPSSVRSQMTLLVREQQYMELIAEGKQSEALQLLQSLYTTFESAEEEMLLKLRSFAKFLFSAQQQPTEGERGGSGRHQLFDQLTEFLSTQERQPVIDLIDTIEI